MIIQSIQLVALEKLEMIYFSGAYIIERYDHVVDVVSLRVQNALITLLQKERTRSN